MKKYIYIAAGGMLGAILRYTIKNLTLPGYEGNFPINTLLINITGGFVLGFFLTMAFDFLELEPEVRLAVATGFLGAYTTFSTMCKENIILIQQGQRVSAILYPTASIILGLLTTLGGILLARELIKRLTGERR